MRRPLLDFHLTTEQLTQMFAPSNEVTVRSWEKRWMENVVANLQLHPKPVPMRALLTEVNHHVSLVCGAGPSLRKLKKRAHLIPPNWGIICVDSAVQAVLEAGLKPTMVVSMDGDQVGHDSFGEKVIQGFTSLGEHHPEVPVVLDIVCCPGVTELVKKPVWFRSIGDGDHIVTKYVNRECPDVTQMGHGGNVGSVCLILSKFWCFSRHVVIIGFDSSMQEGTSRTGYWHGAAMPERHQFIEVVDIYGRPLITMANLHNYKWWADHFCYQNDDVEWINANDGGFLGVRDPASNFNHFKYLTLEQAVDHLKDHGEDD